MQRKRDSFVFLWVASALYTVACGGSNRDFESSVDASAGNEAGAPDARGPDGMGCGQGMVCASGACVACMSGQACTPTNPCHTGALDCSGSMPSCTDKGMNVAPGTSCGQDKVCGATGTCDACVAGMSCP